MQKFKNSREPACRQASLICRQAGFTLVEMVIVIVIIGILAVTLLPKVIGAPASARDANRIVSLSSIAMALETYYSDHRTYPEGDAGGDWGCIDASNDLIGDYINTVPKDPMVLNDKLGGCEGVFRYLAIEKNGTYGAYILAAGVEREQKANVDWDDIKNYTKDTSIQTAITVIDADYTYTSGDVFAYAIYGR